MALSEALKRVRNNKAPKSMNPTSEGIYLSNDQLIRLGQVLKNLYGQDNPNEPNNPNNPDGALFMIGKTKVGNKNVQTVEVIPYKVSGGSKVIYNEGKLSINIGKETPASPTDTHINNNGTIDFTISRIPGSPVPAPPVAPAPMMLMAAGPTSGSQRTPPPFA